MVPFEKGEEVASIYCFNKIIILNHYFAESWHFCSKRLTEKLEKLNERALRFVYRTKSTLMRH